MIFGRFIRRSSKERQDRIARSNTIAEEVLQNFQIVKSFTNEYLESVRYAGSVRDVVRISIRYAKYRGLFFMFLITLLFVGIFFLLWHLAMLVVNWDMMICVLISLCIS